MTGKAAHRRDNKEPLVLRNTRLLVASGVAVSITFVILGFVGVAGNQGMRSRRDAVELSLKLAAAVGALVAGALTWGRLELSRNEHRLDRERTLNERFVKAVELLGSDSETIRLGGLYALEALAGDYEHVGPRQAIYDVICGFVRQRSPALRGDDGVSVDPRRLRYEPDYQAAAAIALRVPQHWSVTLDLSGAVLRSISVVGGSLTDCRFEGAVLTDCRFDEVTLVKCTFTEAKLDACQFRLSTLTSCMFHGATLAESVFAGTALKECKFVSATLTACRFDESSLAGCNFGEAVLTACRFDESTVAECEFAAARLTWCWLHAATIADSRLAHATLTDCRVAGTASPDPR